MIGPAVRAMRRSGPLARAGSALLLVLAVGLLTPAGEALLSWRTLMDLLQENAGTGLLALGMTLVILTAGIDLSVGSVLAAGGMAFAGLGIVGGWPQPLALLAALLLGAGLGAVNGLFVARFRMPPFLVTLAMMVMARGLAKWFPELGGQAIGSKFMPGAEAVPDLYEILAGRVAGVPVTGLLFLGLALVLAALVARTPFGRYLFAVGGNEVASHLAGVPVAAVKLAAYTICGLTAALAGICQVTQDLHGNPGAGTMTELQAIAAVVIGGTSLMGGRGGIGLTVLGVLIIGAMEKVLSLNGVQEHWRLVIQGAIILGAVLLQERD